MRFGIVAALAVAGVLVIANAFPESADRRVPDQPVVTTSPTSQPTDQQPDQTEPQDEPKIEGVKIAVFNTTDVTGLGALVLEDLEEKGYERAQYAENASEIDVTRVYYRSDRFIADARYIAKLLRVDARVDELPPATANLDKSAEVVVYVGTDYAEKSEK